jgi:ABC-type branched-subunit amino acid transport system substrate-binding protein
MAALAVLLAACSRGGGQERTDSRNAPAGGAEAIKVGVLAPLSGPLTPYGDFLKKGVEVGAELINRKGGILGRQVQVLVEDDKTDPAAAAERAKKLLQQDRVDVLMGTISSATTLAVIPLAEQAKVPYMYVVEGEDKTCTRDGKTSPYIFGNGETPEQKFINFVPFMLQNFGKRYYFVGSDYVFPHFVNSIGIRMLKEQGGEVVGEDYAPLGTNNFSTIITKIERSNPDVIFTSVVGTDGVAFLQQLRQFGLDKKMKITGFPSFSTSTVRSAECPSRRAHGAYVSGFGITGTG